MTTPAIEARGLRKAYGGVEAVAGVDLTVDVGEVFALLGPNGAGKTTMVEILEGHRDRSSGEVTVLGHDPAGAEQVFRQRIGIVLQETGVEPFLTVEEAIELYRGYYPNPSPLDQVIDVVGLQGKRETRVNRLSGGQRRRLDVAIGLAGNPELLFLDEPTTGFDPSARRKAWDMIGNLQSLGKTVFLTTHYMDEAQHLADRVAIIVQGHIVAEGAPDILRSRDQESRIRFRRPAGRELPPAIASLSDATAELVELSTTQPTRVLHTLTTWAVDQGVELEGLSVSRASLEEIYLELTGPGEEARA
ncbi:ABC transporter ATP-binding protein [soil metagenome]